MSYNKNIIVSIYFSLPTLDSIVHEAIVEEAQPTTEEIIETPIEEIPAEMVKEAISDPKTPQQKGIFYITYS